MTDPRLPLENPANAALLAFLGERRVGKLGPGALVESCSPDDVEQPYLHLGTHPDVVTRLWNRLDAMLPARCRWVVYATPVTMHPDTGFIFGFGAGTRYSLWLPPAQFDEAQRMGAAEQVHEFPAYPAIGIRASTMDLRTIGDGWVFGWWRREEEAWCLAAFRAASHMGVGPAGGGSL